MQTLNSHHLETLKTHYIEKLKQIASSIVEIKQRAYKIIDEVVYTKETDERLNDLMTKSVNLKDKEGVYQQFVKQLEGIPLEGIPLERPQLFYVMEGIRLTDIKRGEVFTVVKSGNIIAIEYGTVTEVCYLSKVQGFLFLKVPFDSLAAGLLDQSQCLIEAL